MEWDQLLVWGILGLVFLACVLAGVWNFVAGVLPHTEEKERKSIERDLQRGIEELVNEPDGGEWAEKVAKERLEAIQQARQQAASRG